MSGQILNLTTGKNRSRLLDLSRHLVSSMIRQNILIKLKNMWLQIRKLRSWSRRKISIGQRQLILHLKKQHWSNFETPQKPKEIWIRWEYSYNFTWYLQKVFFAEMIPKTSITEKMRRKWLLQHKARYSPPPVQKWVFIRSNGIFECRK